MTTITSPRSESPAFHLTRITSPSIPSPGGTPSSSVRPSFEVPRNGAASPSLSQHATPALGPAPPHRRNRAALRDYYNLKAKAQVGSAGEHEVTRTASIASNASDSTITSSTAPDASSITAQLDESAFDAEAYVSEMLKSASLRDILRTESVLVSEIRNLDGESKALVYDNYSKLIKAVGTIAEMQKGMHDKEGDRFRALGGQKSQGPGLDGVEEVGEKLDGLLTMVKGLSPGNQENLEELAQSRKKKRQKETVKWALDAPVRLQWFLERGQREEAEQEYKAVTDHLDNWSGVKGVSELRAECAKLMATEPEQAEAADEEDSG